MARKVAPACPECLYLPEGQEIAARHYYRPREVKIAAKQAKQFGKRNLITIDAVFGAWEKAQNALFADGGSFDQIYTPRRR